MNPSNDYDYGKAGFDGFMSRSIDDVVQITLDSPGPQSNTIAYDRTQVSGMLGDTLQIGAISLNGASGTIIINDGNNDILLMGEDN